MLMTIAKVFQIVVMRNGGPVSGSNVHLHESENGVHNVPKSLAWVLLHAVRGGIVSNTFEEVFDLDIVHRSTPVHHLHCRQRVYAWLTSLSSQPKASSNRVVLLNAFRKAIQITANGCKRCGLACRIPLNLRSTVDRFLQRNRSMTPHPQFLS